MSGAPAGIGRTSIGVARVRAAESARAGGLFHDPYAAAFVCAVSAGEGNGADDRAARPGVVAVRERFRRGIVVRTRFFDDYLLSATRSGCAQVVLLAAGLDARAFRLPWPSNTTVFEVDLPDVMSFKNRVLQGQHAVASSHRLTVVADLTADWPSALLEAGFDPGTPTAWLVEGLLIYLTPEQADVLLRQVTELSGIGSSVAFERGGVSVSELARSRRLPGMADYTSLFHGGLDRDPCDWLSEHGWSPQQHSRRALAESYGLDAADESGFLVTATRSA